MVLFRRLQIARLILSCVPLFIVIPIVAGDSEQKTSKPPVIATYSGKVVAIHSGNTISVTHEGKTEKIRLYGVNSPEEGQPFSHKAKAHTLKLAFGSDVAVLVYKKNFYGRSIADVILPDGRSLNHEVMRAGLAWWFQKEAPDDETLPGLQKEAMVGKVGLWKDPKPVPPWEYRISPKSVTLNVYTGKKESKYYHRIDCPYLRAPNPSCWKKIKRRTISPVRLAFGLNRVLCPATSLKIKNLS